MVGPMEIYLSGGAVRDLLLGRAATDKDYLVTGATHEEMEARFPGIQQVGKSHPVYLWHGNEYSFPRKPDIQDDLLARDLTINALLMKPDGEIIAHPKGLKDINNRVLRPASDKSFTDDPLRVFRAARFLATLPDFSPHPELLDAMRDTAEKGLLETVYPERIGQELRKALAGPRPGAFLRLLSETGCLNPWLRELADAHGIPAGPKPYHDESVLEHTAQVMDRIAAQSLSEPVRTTWMSLCHDLGKTLTPQDKWPSHHGHDKRGEELARELGERLRLPNIFIDAGAIAARWHMTAAKYDELRPGTRVDLLMSTKKHGTLELLFHLVKADHDVDFIERALDDLWTIINISLPEKDRNLGAESGVRLRELRAQALRDKQM